MVVSSSRNAGELLAEFKSTGRQEAFEEIVRRYAAMVFGVCLKTTRNAHDAEDATQAVFLTLAVQCKTEKAEITYVGPWLQKVARRISLDLRRSRKRREVRETNHATANGTGHGTNGNGFHHDDGQAGIDVEELKVVLNEELNQLPAKYRLPMILHYYGGLTREEIAKELGCKASTLGVRIHRGRQMLAKRLTLRGASPVAMGMSLAVGLSLAVKSAVSDGMVASTSSAAAKLMAGEELGAMISSHVLAVAHGAAGAAMVAKLKLVAAVVIAAVIFGAGAGATAKVLPLDQLRLQLPFTFDGTFRLPTFRSPFRAPQASAAGSGAADQPWQRRVAAAGRSAASVGPVRTVMWMAQDDLVARGRPRVGGGGPADAPAGGAGGLGATGRLLARVVSTVMASTLSNPPHATNVSGTPAATPASAPPSPGSDVAVARSSAAPALMVAHPTAAAAPSGAVAMSTGGGGAALRFEGDVGISNGGTVKPLRPPAGAGGDDASQGPLPAPPPTAVAVTGPTLTVGGAPGSSGRVSLNGGRIHADLQVIGGHGHGEFRQTAGTNVAQDVRLGADPGGYGEYALEGGELVFKPGRPSVPGKPTVNGLEVGDQGTGVFLLGDAKGTGAINSDWNTPGGSLVVRGDPAGVGVFRGWGSVSLGGFFDLSGQAIADGYGSDRTLEFRGFRYVGNGIENSPDGGTNGWFARNHGKLTLPDFRVRTGTATYTWGEDPSDPTLDLVNSARVTLHDVAKAGVLRISLLSNDNVEVPTLPKGHTFIGVWKFDATTIEHGDVDLVVRYDDGRAQELHLNENVLKLWRYQDGEWIRMDHDASFWRDPAQNLIGVAVPAGDFQFFAVSAPEPGTVGVVIAGAAALLLRRPRRRLR